MLACFSEVPNLMRVWLYRWEAGDFSIVFADTRREAIRILDEVGQASSKYLVPIQPGAIHLTLGDDAEFELAAEHFSESLHDHVYKAYPVLDAYEEAQVDDSRELTQEQEYEEMARAVNAERTRLLDAYDHGKAQTPRGQMLVERMNLAPELADEYAREGAAAELMKQAPSTKQ
jgi:hypothetical protein